MSTDAFISWVDSWEAFRPGSRAELRLKVAAMYHSRIFLPVEVGVVEHIAEGISSDAAVQSSSVRDLLKSVYEIDALARPEDILKSCTSPDDPYVWDKNGNIIRGLRGPVFRSLAELSGISVKHLHHQMNLPGMGGYSWKRQAAYLAVASTGGANAWNQLCQVFACDLLCFNEATLQAARRKLPGARHGASGLLLESLEMLIPSVENLDWEHVFHLRVHRHVASFRDWLINNGNKKDSAEMIEGLWAAFSEVVPNVKSSVLKGITSNVPLPIPINPASALFAIQDARNAMRHHKQHGPIIFLHDLRKLTSRKTLSKGNLLIDSR